MKEREWTAESGFGLEFDPMALLAKAKLRRQTPEKFWAKVDNERTSTSARAGSGPVLDLDRWKHLPVLKRRDHTRVHCELDVEYTENSSTISEREKGFEPSNFHLGNLRLDTDLAHPNK